MWSALGHKVEDHEKRKTACISICDEMKCSLRDVCSAYLRMTSEPIKENTLSDEEQAMVEQMRNWAQTARGGGLNG